MISGHAAILVLLIVAMLALPTVMQWAIIDNYLAERRAARAKTDQQDVILSPACSAGETRPDPAPPGLNGADSPGQQGARSGQASTIDVAATDTSPAAGQRLHLVIGGELKEVGSDEFRDLDSVELVGMYPNYAAARDVWRSKSQFSVDDAMMRYRIVHAHRMFDRPDPAPEPSRL
jgi:hypothetical protein